MKNFILIIFIICLDFSILSDEEICESALNEESCINAQLESSSAECCFKTNGNCEFFEEKNTLEEIRYLVMTNEIEGSECARKDNDCFYEEVNKESYKCKNITFPEFTRTYTNDEKNILGDDRHCINLYRDSASGKINEIQKQDCDNALFLDITKEYGIGCGFYDFTVIFKNTSVTHIKTCYFYNPDWFKNEFDEEFGKDILKSLTDERNIDFDEEIESFTLDYSNIEPSIKKERRSRSNSKIIYFSKYLFLFLVIVL